VNELKSKKMINNSEYEILKLLKRSILLSSKEIHDGLKFDISYATVKRILTKLIADNLISVEGKGKATRYFISKFYALIFAIDLDEYFLNDINERNIIENFNFKLLDSIFPKAEIFTLEELKFLKSLHDKYLNNIATLSNTLYKRDLERLGIDLSWKSSQIEGNTYSLLETEQLLKEKIAATGKQKEEAIMLLNHKSTLDYILDSPNYFLKLDTKKVIEVHSLLVDGLDVEKNLRKRTIGITGTNYKPLDNEHQVKEAIEATCSLVNSKENIFEKAIIILVLLSYIQAFEDGNKRTARLMSNAVLISNNYCPISFRTVDSINYKKAMLIFYEQNNISAFKKIFMEQYEFAVNTYFQ